MKHIVLALCLVLQPTLAPAFAQDTETTEPSFTQLVSELEHKVGFLDLYVDETAGAVLAALPKPDEDGVSIRFIYGAGLTAGLGSNPIGLDRGNADAAVIVRFRKIGNKIVAEQENWRYRATADRPEERRSVRQSFASSFLWSTEIKAQSTAGEVLIDLSSFLTRDQHRIAPALKFGAEAGGYSLVKDRSFPDTNAVFSFPDNAELDAFLTFETSRPNGQTIATAADGRAVTLVQHHSFVRLPDDGYTPRLFDQRTANIGMGYYDYSAPLDAPIVTRLSRRFRLKRVDPELASGPVTKPIVFYVDPGAPAQIREALIDGALWWKDGFEAAGFEDAYRVEVLPDGAHPLDVRYNVINWVHRQTRGWSYGGSVSDPRTGEILKANVILGSQRVRQDRMIFEGLAGTSKTGTGAPDDPVEIALARIRQLAAHEVGHTLGFAHNFAASSNNRASVMDYPAPYIRPTSDGGLDFSQAYGIGLGAWDIFTAKWLYTEFSSDQDGTALLEEMVNEAYGSGLRFVGDSLARSQGTAHPYASVWDNGEDAVGTLEEVMRVREIGLQNFGRNVIQAGRPNSDLSAVIVPIYLYHRYQVAAVAKSIGGLEFQYGNNGDSTPPARPVAPANQRRALEALIATLDPSVLDLPDKVTNLLTPGDVGFAGVPLGDELFPSRSGPVFDLLSAADVSANLTLSTMLHPDRVGRLLEFERRNPDALTLIEMLDQVEAAVFAKPEQRRHEAITRMIQSRYVLNLIALSRDTSMHSDASTIADGKLRKLQDRLGSRRAGRNTAERDHFAALAARIGQHLDADLPADGGLLRRVSPPPGSPIGSGRRLEGLGQGEDCWHCDP